MKTNGFKRTEGAAATILLLMVVLLAGCTSRTASTPSQTPAVKGTPVTGRAGFQEMFSAARLWEHDAQPQSLASQGLSGVPGSDGKAPVWRARFVSVSTRQQRTYQYVAVQTPDGPDKGVNKGPAESWDGTAPFDVSFIKTDSDAAFRLAQKHGGASLLREHKNFHVFYDLNREAPESGRSITWQISYGENRATAPLVVHVAADTGAFEGATGPAAKR